MSKITGLEAPNQVPPKATAMYRAVSTLLREDKDISEMSVSMITGLAGIGKGTAYEYFDSKEEIIVCALLYEIRTVTEQASRQIQTCPDLETQIHRMLLLVEEHSQCVDAIMAFLHLLTDGILHLLQLTLTFLPVSACKALLQHKVVLFQTIIA